MSYFIDSLPSNIKISLMNHFEDLPSNIQMEIRENIIKWIREYFLDKQKRKPKFHPFSSVASYLPEKYVEWCSNEEHSDIQDEYNRILIYIMKKVESSNYSTMLKKLLHSNSYDDTTCGILFDTLTMYCIKHQDELTPQLVEYILFKFMNYKVSAIGTYISSIKKCKISEESIWSYEINYYNLLLKWIQDLGQRMKDESGLHIEYISDIAIGIFLFISGLKLKPDNDFLFLKYFENIYGSNFSEMLHKKIVGLSNNGSDLLVSLEMIKDKDAFTDYFTKNTIKKIETLQQTNRVSEENGGEILLFGENIIPNGTTPREFSDTVSMLDKSYIKPYFYNSKLKYANHPITFTLSDSSKMYLRDMEGIRMMDVITKTDTKTIAEYQNENGGDIFLLFEISDIDEGIIYGISVYPEDGYRGIIIIEKVKDGTSYKFVYGGDF